MGSQAAVPAQGSNGDNLSSTERKTLRKAIAGSAIGNAIEWYDYGLYGFLAASIEHNFLPETPYGRLITFVIFAVPFTVRPLGAGVFGAIGDRLGRQRILALTVILISGGTFLIGATPNFDTISYAAPTILVLLRIVQGLAAGGEYGGAATFMAEYAPDKRRGFFGSWLEFGTLSGFLAGTIIGSALQAAMSGPAFDSWGWRIPFLLAGPIGLFGLYMRSKLEDTPVFRELAEKGGQEQETKTQFKDLFKNWRPVVICMGMVFMLNVHNYTLFVYIVEFLTDPEKGGLSGSYALLITSVMFALMMVLMPFGGAASDRWGRRPSWFTSGIGLFVLALPMFWLILNVDSVVVKMAALVVMGIVYVPQLSTISATFPAMFPTQIRYTAFALSYNIATAIAGGPTPAINTYFTNELTDYFPALFMMAASVIGIVAVKFAPETAGASLRGTEIPDVEKQKAGSSTT